MFRHMSGKIVRVVPQGVELRLGIQITKLDISRLPSSTTQFLTAGHVYIHAQ